MGLFLLFVFYIFSGNEEAIDVVVAFDTSDQVDSNMFNQIKTFLRNMVNAYKIGPDNVRIGLINFASQQKVIIKLSEGNSEKKLIAAIQKITKLGKILNI